jgi:hypothetical protein
MFSKPLFSRAGLYSLYSGKNKASFSVFSFFLLALGASLLVAFNFFFFKYFSRSVCGCLISAATPMT